MRDRLLLKRLGNERSIVGSDQLEAGAGTEASFATSLSCPAIPSFTARSSSPFSGISCVIRSRLALAYTLCLAGLLRNVEVVTSTSHPGMPGLKCASG